MPESHQDKGPEEGSPSLDREDMTEKSAGFRAAHPPTETDVEVTEGEAPDAATETADSPELEIDKDAGDNADAVVNAPRAAKPGEKDDPDMKDMGVGPRPTDEQSAR